MEGELCGFQIGRYRTGNYLRQTCLLHVPDKVSHLLPPFSYLMFDSAVVEDAGNNHVG